MSQCPTSYNLHVCNAFTGHVTDFLPPFSLPHETTPSGCSALNFVLLAGAEGRSFELLVAGTRLHTQIFSSDHWEWGPVRDTTSPQHPHNQGYYDAIPQSQPTVIGRTVYWFCPRQRSFPFEMLQHRNAHTHILSLDVDVAEATKRNVPTACDLPGDEEFDSVLLTCVRGQLSLFLLHRDGISAWTTSAAEVTTAWSRQFLVVTKSELQARAVLDPSEFTDISLHAYGARSGTLIALVGSFVFLRIDIGEDFDLARVVRLENTASLDFLHEIYLVSLLHAMKSFPQGHVSNGPAYDEELGSEDDPQRENKNKHWKVEFCPASEVECSDDLLYVDNWGRRRQWRI